MFRNAVPISQRMLNIYYKIQMLSTASGRNNIHSWNHTKPGNTLCEENVMNYNYGRW